MMHSNTLSHKNHSGSLRAFSQKGLSSFLSAVLLLSMVLPVSPSPVSAAVAPDIIYPVDGMTFTATGENGTEYSPPQALPMFQWNPVPEALTYRLEISTDINWAPGSERMLTLTPLTQYMPTAVNTLKDGTWYWRVRVETSKPAAPPSAWTYGSFVKDWASEQNLPELVSPLHEEKISFFDPPIFRWDPVIGAATYKFQVSSNSSFSAPLKLDVTTQTTTYQHPTSIENGTYYWRVIPVDPANQLGTPSLSPRVFTISYDQVPLLIEPANGSNPVLTPVLRWTAVRGANYYQLRYSSDSTFGSGVVEKITRNTTYTFVDPLPNDVNYYWQVRAFNGTTYSEWSNKTAPWSFRKSWYIKPVPLTPTSLFQHVRFPFFSWTPVPGASKYLVAYCTNPDMKTGCVSQTTINTFYTPLSYNGTAQDIYWQVTAQDSLNHYGGASDVSQFKSFQGNNNPDLISPLYYYPPLAELQPHEDRSTAYPLFTWSRRFTYPGGNEVARAYRISVGTTVNPDGTVGNVVWSKETENLSAAPDLDEFINPQVDTDYFWQVTPLDDMGGQPIGLKSFSQAWKTRFNPAKELPATAGPKPQLLRPVYTSTYQSNINPGYDSAEFVEITPALEWFPVNNTDHYEVEISRNSAFAPLVDSGTVKQPVYVPTTSFGQRFLNHLGYGSYYWRVRACTTSSSSSCGTYSDTWRFQIASQSQWKTTRTIGDVINRLEVARDAGTSEPPADYDLNGLYAAQDTGNWYFGFDYSNVGTSTYVLYLDRDNRDNSGATSDQRNYPLTTNFAHRPEFVIYIDKVNGTITAGQIFIYTWDGSTWVNGKTLESVGGSVYTNVEGTFLELKLPNQSIGMDINFGTYSLALSSLDLTGTPAVKDTVPENGISSGAANLDQFTTVSEHLTLASPPSNLTGDPNAYSSTSPFFWNGMVGTPWAGWVGKIYLDAGFTQQPVNGKEFTITQTSGGAHYAQTADAYSNDMDGNNTYYWRIQPRYNDGTVSFGSFSQAWRFTRSGFVPQNLQESVTMATPTFSWDRVEGAAKYRIQVDDDPQFGSTVIDQLTSENTYTPTDTLPRALYYWRVRVIRGFNEPGAWSPSETFTLTMPVPEGLTPTGTTPVGRVPTFCWNVLSVMKDGVAVFYPWKYRLQVSRGSDTFTSTYEDFETRQNCWTPTRVYPGDRYYWRVAMFDGNNRMSDYSSPVASFLNAYPLVKTKLPANGSQSTVTPIFSWTAENGETPYVHGAAQYQIEICRNADFTYMCETTKTVSTTYTPTKNFTAGVNYYWRVAMVDTSGNLGPYTKAEIFVNQFKAYLPIIRR